MDYTTFVHLLEEFSRDQLKIALKELYRGATLEEAIEIAKEYSFKLPGEFTPNTGTN